MRYWDTSALVPLLVREGGTDLARGWLREDAHIITWAFTRLEIASAVERRAREGALDRRQRRRLLDRLDEAAGSWDEVTDLLPVRKHATSLLARHALRAADAVQLGAAWVTAEGDPSSLELVCLDRGLADAAEREGFAVLTWPT